MKQNVEIIKSLLNNLQKDVAKLNVLISSLERQYELLSARRTDELKKLNNEILSLLDNLNESNKDREAYLRKLGLPVNKSGMQMLKEKLPSPLKEAMAKLLEELAMKSSVCCMMNEKSGHMLSTQRQIISRLTGNPDKQSYPDLPFNIHR